MRAAQKPLHHQMKPKASISKEKVFSEMTGIHDSKATKELDEHARTKLSIRSPNNQKQFPFLKFICKKVG